MHNINTLGKTSAGITNNNNDYYNVINNKMANESQVNCKNISITLICLCCLHVK